MIAFLARFIGLWLIAGALVAVVVDGTKTIAGSALTITSFEEAWTVLSPATLQAAQAFVQGKLEPTLGHWLWNPAIHWVLGLPAFAVLGAVGGWLAYIGRKRRATPVFA